MLLEFIEYDKQDDILLSLYGAQSVCRKGEICHLQLKPEEPYTTYIVEEVQWQMTALHPDELAAMIIVRRKDE